MEFILLLLLILILVVLGAYLLRDTSLKRIKVVGTTETPPEATSTQFRQYLKLFTSTDISDGNGVKLLLNGDGTFPELWKALEQAQRVICLHVFLMARGTLSETLLKVLSERAQEGVEVYVLFDALGAGGLESTYKNRLRTAGAHVAIYRPLKLSTLYKYQQRMHIRAVVIDGRTGFTGGFGMSDEWLGDGLHENQWRDTNVRITGPIAQQLEVAFATNWAEATGDLLLGNTLSCENSASEGGTQSAGIMICQPALGATNAEKFFFLVIASARERIYITNAYFVPSRGMRQQLMNAVDRGVDVRVILPGAKTDQLATWYAARTMYPQLLSAGVRIYEYQPTMVHAKTFVADGCWSTVGTLNFDNRSTKLNDEVALVIRDKHFASELEVAFFQDLEHSLEIVQSQATLRGMDRVKGRLARLISPLL